MTDEHHTSPEVFPATITLDGPDPKPIVLTIDRGGNRLNLSPAEARALAADLESMANLAEGWDDERG